MAISSRKTLSEEPRLIMIMGDGRSGSTILSIILGNHHQIQSVGELPQWLVYGGEAKKEGTRPEVVAFWESVRRRYSSKVDLVKLPEFRRAQSYVEAYSNFWSVVLSNIPSHVAKAYCEHNLELLRSITESSGKPLVLDSSKKPARALMLWRCMGDRLYVIHLVRDPRATMWSEMKRNVEQKHKAPVVSLLHYNAKNLMSEVVKLRIPKRQVIRVRYEDIAKRPLAELKRIGDFLGLSMTTIGQKLLDGAEFMVPPLIDGNRIRNKRYVKFRFDSEWCTKLTPTRRVLGSLITLPFFVAYRYWKGGYE